MLIVAAILAILVYGLVAPMLGSLLPSYQLSVAQNGILTLINALGLVLASLGVGPLIDNKGKKFSLLIGLALVAISLYWAPNAGGYSGLLGVYFMLGLGGGIVVTGANALAGDVDVTRRASTLNFLNLFFGLGGLLTPVISGIVTPIQLCYLVAGLTTVTLLVHIVTKMPPPTHEQGFQLSEAGSLLSKPSLFLLSLFLFLYVTCEVGVWNWLKSYLISLNIDQKTASNIVGYGFAFGLLVGRVVVSRILIRISALTVTLASAVLMAITTFIMLHTTDTTALAVAVFCAGLAMAPVFPTTLAMVADAFPKGTATAMGIAITFGWIGLAVSSPIIANISSGSTLQKGLLILPLASAGMVLVNLLLRSAMKRPATV